MKIALVTDTHWGVRNDNMAFADHFGKFYRDIFFPYINKHNIKNIIHLGDVVDRRKYINYMTARKLYDDFIEPCIVNDLQLDIIIGNHDTYYKNTNRINSINELYRNSLHNISLSWEPEVKTYDGLDILFVPWICAENYQQTMDMINETSAQVAFGHLELKGFQMYRGHVNDHGFDPSIFNKFDSVISGHFHHRSSNGNVHYLGTPYEITWSDYNDSRGFHIFDTETRELEFIQNPYRMFHKIFYDDLDKTIEDVVDVDFEPYKDSFVKVVVKTKTNPYWFDMVIDRLEKVAPIEIQVVDAHFHKDDVDDEDIVDEAEDTLTILNRYIESMNTNVNKKQLDLLVKELYDEALTIV